MIYLFDDNDNQQMSKNYNLDFLEVLQQYTSIITHINSYSLVNDIENCIKNSRLVCIHDSFPTPDDKARIVALALANNTPLVIFSGGADFTITKFDATNRNFIRTIKKDRFYYYLIQLLDDYLLTKTINLNILALGSNYEKVRLNIIIDRLGKNLFQSFNTYNYLTFFESGTQNYKDLCEIFSFTSTEENFETNLFYFEESIEQLKIQEVYKIITDLTKKTITKDGK